MHLPRLILLLSSLALGAAHAAPAPFDLAGPALQIRITRGTVTLPVSQVPNLAEGDKLWLKADLPPNQSAHYLLVTAFLSGSTNPPPKEWFVRCETWKGTCARDGFTVTVPVGAQQVLVFLAPQTGGDFKTVINTVRGRPGAFVRASQDLNQAALDRARLDLYLSSIRQTATYDPAELKSVVPLLARSLAVKVDEKCLEKHLDLQAPCLMQGQESLILDDGHSGSVVAALASGPAADLAMEASFTPQLGLGYYSPYVASVLDIARIFDSFRTAQYQYIPALSSSRGDRITLTLNTAPSFHNPLSVLVAALPAVQPAQMPPLHALDPKELLCASRTPLLLPAEGAPLVFSGGYAHDLTLKLAGKDGKSHELPARADAKSGGLRVDATTLSTLALEGNVRASLQGYWGFDRYTGPSFLIADPRFSLLEMAPGDEAGLIVGRPGTVRLRAENISCVDTIMVQQADGRETRATWKAAAPGEIEVQLPLQDAKPGSLALLISQSGSQSPQSLALRAFAEASRIEQLNIHTGDSAGVLTGARLDKVARVSVNGVAFTVGKLSTQRGSDSLAVTADDASTIATLKQDSSVSAKVVLQDGRTFNVPVIIESPRPRVALIGKSVRPSRSSIDSNIQLSDPDELPQDSQLVFSLRADAPAVFPRDTRIELAVSDEVPLATLSLSDRSITLENRQVAVATLDPSKTLSPSTFGELQFRVSMGGAYGDWQPLATLVRLPALKELKCTAAGEGPCKLAGSNLFLIDSVSGNARFENPVIVPPGFLGASMTVPHPASGQLYVKLRDNPAVINPVSLAPQEPAPASPDIAPAAAGDRQ